MAAHPHVRGLHRGYADNLRVEWDRRGKGGYSSITLLNTKKRPVAVLLGDYVPGEIDREMEAAANLFCAASDLLAVVQRMEAQGGHGLREHEEMRAAIAKATGQ